MTLLYLLSEYYEGELKQYISFDISSKTEFNSVSDDDHINLHFPEDAVNLLQKCSHNDVKNFKLSGNNEIVTIKIINPEKYRIRIHGRFIVDWETDDDKW